MRILTVDNVPFSMNNVPDNVDDLRYCVLDYSDQRHIDYVFIPLLFLESFNCPAVDLRIGQYRIQMPIDWHIIIGPNSDGECELVNLKQINDRSFQAFTMNPIRGYMPNFLDIEILNIFPDVNWYFPKMKYGHLLCVPLEDKEKPQCCFFVKETNRIPESLDITQMV